MKFKKRPDSRLAKKARHGFRGYPSVTVAFYGPDAEPVMERLFSETGDVRHDRMVEANIMRIIKENGVKSVAMLNRIIGCPHEEGIDYPDGEKCLQCPFWADRDRWTGEPIDEFSKARALAQALIDREDLKGEL
jgi:hypothetical protein